MHSLTQYGISRARVFAACTLLAGGACSSLASESDTLTGSAPERPWRCFEKAGSRREALVPPDRLDYSLQVLDLATKRPPTNFKVRACGLSDLTCSRPVAAAAGLNADGRVALPLTLGFDGFLELTADDMGPTLFVFPEPLSRELATLTGSQPITVLSLESLESLQASLRTPTAAETGQLAVTALDCNARLAAGVRVQVAPPAVPFAVIGRLPVAQRDTTAADGIVGFLNVPAGVALVNAAIVDLNATLDPRTAPIRTGWITQITVLPAPVPFD